MSHARYKTRKEAFQQLDRLVGRWLDESGSESTYEWMSGGNFMIQKLGEDAVAGLEIIGYDAQSKQLKSSFYASDEGMLDNSGRPINYVYNIIGEDLEIILDAPDRHGSFVGKLTSDDAVLSGRWDWEQNGEKMGYDVKSSKQLQARSINEENTSHASYDDIVAIAPESHKVLFENDTIRILKITVKPGEKVGMHKNPENINYILKPGTLRLSGADNTAVDIDLSEGQVIPAPKGQHAVENIGNTEVQTIGIELKNE